MYSIERGTADVDTKHEAKLLFLVYALFSGPFSCDSQIENTQR